MRLIIALSCVASMFVGDRLRAHAADHQRATMRYEALYRLPHAEILPSMSLGYRRALADLIWMKALVYFGEEMGERGGVDHVFRYTEAMLELDPDFRAAYFWVGVAGLYRPRGVTRSEVEQVIAIQRRGLERFPDDGELYWEVATNLQYVLVPRLIEAGEVEAKEEAELEASRLMLEAAARGAAPEYVIVGTADRLESLGQREHAIRQLERMYLLVDEEATRQQIAARLSELKGLQATQALESDRERITERWQEERPWVPLPFWALTSEAAQSRGLPAEHRDRTVPGQ